MNKKLIIGIAGIVVAALAVGFLASKNSDDARVTLRKDDATGLSIYTNLDYGFSVAYPNDYWQGPVEKFDPNSDVEDLSINAVFASTSTLEAIVIAGKPGDTETFNDFAKGLDSYTVVTVGGLPALRYEYAGPINEEGTAYAKTVMFVFKGLPKGSITIAYQKLASTEAQAKAADLTKLNDFISRITFN